MGRAAFVLVVCMLAQVIGVMPALAAPPVLAVANPTIPANGTTIPVSETNVYFFFVADIAPAGEGALNAITMYNGLTLESVPVTASIDGSTLTVTREAGDLPWATGYVVSIPSGTLKDVDTGDVLEAPQNLSFGTEVDTDPPTLYNSWIRADKVTLQFWDAKSGMDVTAELPDPGDFTVTVGGVPIPVVSVGATSEGFMNLVLTLQNGVVDTTTDIDLAYVYNAGEGDNPIVDIAGNALAGLAPFAIENVTPADLVPPQMEYAFVLAGNPTVVQTYFDEKTKAVGGPFETDFVIEVNGAPVTILSTGFNGDCLVEFETNTSIVSTDSVTISYTGAGNASDNWENMLAAVPETEVHNFSTGYDVPDVVLFPTVIRTTADPVTFIVTGADMSAGMGTLAVLIDSLGSSCWAEVITYAPEDPDFAVFTSSAHTFADDASTTVYTFDVIRQIVSGVNIPLATATFTVSPTASAVQVSAPDIDVDASDLASVTVTWADVMVYGGPGTVTYQIYRSLNPKTALEDPEGESWVETLVNANATSPCSDNLTALAADYRQARYMVQATYEGGSPVSQSLWSPPIVIPLPDAPGNLKFNNPTYTVAENAGTAIITVTRTGGSTGAVSVDYATADGAGDHPGVAGTDYTTASGTLTFATGETSKTFEVTVADDAVVDGDKTVNLALVAPSGGASLGGNSTAVLTIVDNEAPSPGVLAFSLATGSKSENAGTANVPVIRTGGADGTVTVDYEVTAGTASSGSDYTLAPGTLTFGNGETSKTIEVAITNDADQEGPEFLVITLVNPGGGATVGAESSYSLTISDDDLPIVWNDADADHIYYHGDDIAFTITGSGIPNGAPARVAVGVYTELGFDSTLAPLTGMNRQGTSYYYVNSTSVGGNLSVSGFVNNPGNNTLPAGLLAIQVYISMDMGATWTAPGPAIPLIASGDQIGGLVGITVPADTGIAVTPGFETLTSLFSTNVPITFSKALPGLGEGSITFPAGLDIVNFSEELQALDEGVNMLGDADPMTGEVTYVMGIDTADLSFLSSKGATIKIDGLPAGFTNPVITTDGTGDASEPVIDGDLLTFDVTHFSNYTIMGDIVIPVTAITVTPESVTLAPTETSQLTSDVDPDDASEPGVTWSSSDDAIASVSAAGLVTANSVGSAVITAKSDDNNLILDTCTVTVRVAATGVSLPESLSLDVPQTATLTATLIPIDATNQAIMWQSSNAEVATVEPSVDVDNEATVTAVGIGNATITATTADGGHSDACAVTVALRVSSVSLDRATMAIEPGETGQLTATVNPAGASNPAVTWQSSDVTKAQVDGDGTVTGVAAGTADITVTTVDGGKTATCAVTMGAVAPAWPVGTSTVTTADVAKTGLTLNWSAAADRVAVAAYKVYRDGTLIHTTADGTTRTYAVTGLTAGTQYTFVIEAGDALNAWSTTGPSVTVTTLPEPVTGVTLLPDTLSLETGGASVELTATVAPIGPPAASNKAITWSSSNNAVATVASTGATTASVTPVGPGTVTITVTTTDGSFTDTCAVTVTQPVTGVTLNLETLTMEVGQTAQLTAVVAPANASNKTLEWGSSNNTYATLVGNPGNVTGKVTAVAVTAGLPGGTVAVGAQAAEDNTKVDVCAVTILEGAAPAWAAEGTSLTASGISSSGLTLTWSNTATDNVAVTQYRIYRGETLVGTVNAPTLTYSMTGLAASTEYTFTVQAGDASGRWSTTGPSATATTIAAPASGGGGYTPPPAPKPDPVIEGNRADVTGSSTVTTSTNTNGTTTSTVTVTQSTINQALSTGSGVNQVVVKTAGTAQEQVTSLPAQSFTTMAEKSADLVIETDKASLSIPPQVVNVAALSEELNVAADQIQVRVSVQEVSASEADNLKSKIAILDENLQPVGSILQLNIEATAAGKSVKIDTFGDNTVTGEIPFSPTAVQGDVRKLCVYRFNDATGTWEPVPSRVDAVTGKVTFFTDHFSNYTIMSLNKTFTDLVGHWAKDDVELMAARWVVKGDTATSYAPERSVTRAEFAALLVRALGLKWKVVVASTFSDVAITSWYSGSVEAAAAAEIVSGVGNGAFAPEASITREEMAAMVVRAMRVAGSPVSLSSDEATSLLEVFTDQAMIDTWAADDLAKAVKSGIVQGVSSAEIAPQSSATRAQAATMVKRMMEKAGLL